MYLRKASEEQRRGTSRTECELVSRWKRDCMCHKLLSRKLRECDHLGRGLLGLDDRRLGKPPNRHDGPSRPSTLRHLFARFELLRGTVIVKSIRSGLFDSLPLYSGAT